MRPNQSKFSKNNDGGYVLIGVLVIISICLLISGGLSRSATSTTSIRQVIHENTENFYDVERSINAVTAWLQANSKNIVTAFNSTNFSNNFDLGDPVVGGNEGSAFAPATMLKMKGTNNAVQLTNSSFFGTSAFPATNHVDTNAAFDAVSAFQSADFGANVNVRLLAIWALQTDGHYQPIFRVDAVTGGNEPEHGVHGFNFIKSALVTSNGGIGYYAQAGDFQTGSPNNQCWSYQYTYNNATSTWSRGAPRSNCLVTARDDVSLKSLIHGNLSTTKENGITYNPGGAVSGTACDGPTCSVTYTLPNNPTWDARCGAVPAVDVTAAANPTNLATGATLATQCFRTITVPSNRAIRFTTPDQPYYIKTLDLQNNSNSRWLFNSIPPGQKYIIYVDRIVGDRINGNQLVGTNLAPSQLEIYLTQDGTFTLNGTADMNGVITGTANHTIVMNGNFSFVGALRSNALTFSGNAVLGYDEGLGGPPVLSDMNFTLFKASQRYR